MDTIDPRASAPPGAQAEPQSIGQLISLLFKQMRKTLPLTILLGGGMFLGVWLLHT